MLLKRLGLVVALGSAAMSSVALADDWVAASVSGTVMTVKNGHWARLQANDAVSDRQVVRTLSSGSVTFRRNGETVTVAGNSQISIAEERGGHYTRVTQWFGQTTVADTEEARPHFEVDTPYMAAVVKGTVFTVWTKPGVSGVAVARGRVEVNDHSSDFHVDVLAGQRASGGTSQPLSVTGSGKLQPIENAAGKIVAVAQGATETAPVKVPAKATEISATPAGPAKPSPMAPGVPAAAPKAGAPGGPGQPGPAGNGKGPGSGGPGKSGNAGGPGKSGNAGGPGNSGNAGGPGNSGNAGGPGNSGGPGGGGKGPKG